MGVGQGWEAVVDPADAGRGMAAAGLLAQGGGGFGGDDLPPLGREPFGIPARAGVDMRRTGPGGSGAAPCPCLPARPQLAISNRKCYIKILKWLHCFDPWSGAALADLGCRC